MTMTIDEAIGILTIHNDHNPNFTDEQDALQLGIEGLKRVKELRRLEGISHQKPLPGETKE